MKKERKKKERKKERKRLSEEKLNQQEMAVRRAFVFVSNRDSIHSLSCQNVKTFEYFIRRNVRKRDTAEE